jgi:hypothetical protein
MSSELRPVTQGGIVAAGSDSITVRVPYAFGVACFQIFGTTIVSLLPGDSAIYRSATASGYAYRDPTTTAAWTIRDSKTPGAFNLWPFCGLVSPSVTTLAATGWTTQGYSVPETRPDMPVGSLVYFYQQITYAFAPSVTLPGRKALWRRVASTGASDELVLPFDTGSGFQFLVGSRLTVRATAPAILDSVLGVRVRLIGQSEQTPEGKSAPSRFDMSTNILFRNNAAN